MRAPYSSIGSTSVFVLEIKQEFPVWEMLRSVKTALFWCLEVLLRPDQMPVQYKCVCPSIYLQDYCKAEADMFLFEVQQSVIPCRNTSTRALKGVVLVGQISWYLGVILLSLAVQFQALPFRGCDTSEWGSSDLTSNALRHPKSFWSETNCPGAHEIRRMWAKKQESIAGRGRPDFWLKWKKK